MEPLRGMRIAQKSVKHSPQEKLLDALVGDLCGCKALYEMNSRVRPDLPLQRAFGRERVADQSTISRTLNAFTPQTVGQLREAVESIYRANFPIFSHDFGPEVLLLEVDLTGLRASKQAEGATKGYFSGERNATVASSPGCAPRNTGRSPSRSSIRAAPTPAKSSRRPWGRSSAS